MNRYPAAELESLASAAARHGVTVKTIRRRIADGTITGYRSGPRLIRVDPVEVDAALLKVVPTGRTAVPDAIARWRAGAGA